jgi:hypothetical protein
VSACGIRRDRAAARARRAITVAIEIRAAGLAGDPAGDDSAAANAPFRRFFIDCSGCQATDKE